MSSNKYSTENTLRVINATSISSLLDSQEALIVDKIRLAYESHYDGLSNLPHSVFLRFPDSSRNRIIGLPGYLDGDEPSAGFKWIASFPENHMRSLDRASALMVLNCMDTGFPKAVLEASIISAKRTAASAALATMHLYSGDMEAMGIIGCGLIGFEIIMFIKAMHPSLKRLYVHDLHQERAEHFVEKFRASDIEIEIFILRSVEEIFHLSPVVALATTSPAPYINKSHVSTITKLILNISLRDLSPDIILEGINVVDDSDHVCRERTSLHLAEELTGNRQFILCTIADITKGNVQIKHDNAMPIIFSPFGLGVLDLSIAEYIFQRASKLGLGYLIEDFFPRTWHAKRIEGAIQG